ncbi:MAG: HAD family hydrolase [Betaproteobacteria bacterium]|nr:HAD family hydrolase [Betaproteobacteria bacterium]
MRTKLKAVWFDLDGTLVDSAPDLAVPIHEMRQDRGLSPLEDAILRPYTSMGARGLIWCGFGVKKDEPAFEALRVEFLARYEKAMVVHTQLFPGMEEVLDHIESKGLIWGVVSNKFERYVKYIVDALDLTPRCAAIVGGDTTPFPKPNPANLFYACGAAAVDPRYCVYVGDDLRDVEAGRAAGMKTVAAAYGYCGDELPPSAWGADGLIETPLQLRTWLAREIT